MHGDFPTNPHVPAHARQEVGYFKKRLMYCVAGLDRGFAANDGAELAVEAAIYSLVGAAGGAPELSWTASALPWLQGEYPMI